jgi:hypothetical protein
MDPHATRVYKHTVAYLEEKKIVVNHNIIEYVCRYHHCSDHPFKLRKNLFLELKKYFSTQTVNVIMQLIVALGKGVSGTTYPKWKEYLVALQKGETLAIAEESL